MRYCWRIILAVLLTLGTGAPTRAAENWAYPEPIASWDAATKERQRESARGLVAALKAAVARGDRQFTIPPGDYRFGPKGPANFDLVDIKDLRVEARGVTFWIEARQRIDAIRTRNCKNLSVHGLTVDYDSLGFSQGEVVAIDRAGKTVDIRIDPGFPLPEEYGWTETLGSTKAIFYDPQGRQRDVRMDWVKSLQALGGGLYRARFTGGWILTDGSDFQVGDRLTLPDRSMRHAFALNDSEAVTLEDITVYACPHMAFSEVGGKGGHVYRRCKVVRRPGTRRLLACNADVFHSIFVENGPTIEECEFSHSGDDFINIHAFFYMVLEQRSPTELVVVQHYQKTADTGAELAFYDFGTLAPLGSARVQKMTVLDAPEVLAAAGRLPAEARERGDNLRDFHRNLWPCLVQLDRPVAVKKFDMVGYEGRMARGTRIRNNHFHDTFTRGILLKCADAVVEGNTLERTGQAGIALAAERYWMEGPFPHHLTIRDNTLVDCGTMRNSRMPYQHMLGAISVVSVGGKGLSPGMPNHHIRITGNRIVRPSVCGIFLANARDCVVEGNTIEGACFREPLRAGADHGFKDPLYAIYLTAVEGITLGENRAIQPGAYCLGAVGRGALVK